MREQRGREKWWIINEEEKINNGVRTGESFYKFQVNVTCTLRCLSLEFPTLTTTHTETLYGRVPQ